MTENTLNGLVLGKLLGGPLRAASHFVSSGENGRFYLQGVRVEAHPDGGVLYSATDGTVATRIWCGESVWPWEPATIVVSADTLKLLASSKKALKRALVLGAPQGDFRRSSVATVAVGDVSMREALMDPEHPARVDAIEGSFPDLERVFGRLSEKPTGILSFNAALLAKFEKAGRDMTGNRSANICLAEGHEYGPMIVSIAGAPHFVGLLMPLRFANNEGVAYQGKPDWASPGACARRKASKAAKAA